MQAETTPVCDLCDEGRLHMRGRLEAHEVENGRAHICKARGLEVLPKLDPLGKPRSTNGHQHLQAAHCEFPKKTAVRMQRKLATTLHYGQQNKMACESRASHLKAHQAGKDTHYLSPGHISHTCKYRA